MDDITRIQRYFARKAQAQPTYRFRDLYSLVWKPSYLEYALNCVLANQGSRSAGIDGVTVKAFQDPEYRMNFIQTLSQELKSNPEIRLRAMIFIFFMMRFLLMR